MKYKLTILATLAALPLLVPTQAQARDYCKNYTTTIRIGGKAEVGVGTACKRDRHVWEITRLQGSSRARERVQERIYESLYDDDVRITIVNHYDPRPRYRSSYYGYRAPVRYVYAPPRHHYKKHRRQSDHRDHRGHGHNHGKKHGHKKGHGKGRH